MSNLLLASIAFIQPKYVMYSIYYTRIRRLPPFPLRGEGMRFPYTLSIARSIDAGKAVILGHEGLLDYFTATFGGENCVVTLEPNDSIPRA